MTTHRGTTTDTLIDVVPLSETTSRVGDTRRGAGDSRRIVGYIHTVADGFEMLWMRPRPGVTYRYGSFAEAVQATERRLRLIRASD